MGWRYEIVQMNIQAPKYANEIEEGKICEIAITLDSQDRFG